MLEARDRDRRADLDAATVGRLAGRPRWRVVGARPRRDLRGSPARSDVATYKTWVHGAHLLVDDGRTRRYTGLIPKISPLAIVTIALAQLRLDRMAKGVPVDAPWTAKHAAGVGFAIRRRLDGALRRPHRHRP